MAVAGKFVKQLAGSGTGQSMMDRVVAAKHSIAGSGLGLAVCKATTEEIIAPKKKHIDYLIQCSNEANVSIPELANNLIDRSQQQSWVIVFKSLITTHNLMNFGNERFFQYLASNNTEFKLQNFADKTSGIKGFDMSEFVRRYAKYINEKSVSYRLMAFDFCKIKRGKDDGVLRIMVPDKLLIALPSLQALVEVLLDFDANSSDLTNCVINAAYLLMFKDLIRLFACYNDGIINLLEKYFQMNKKQCRLALDIYKTFLIRMDKVGRFLRVAESIGIERGDIPDLAKAPASLLDTLEHHLATLEGRKYSPPPRKASLTFDDAVELSTPETKVESVKIGEVPAATVATVVYDESISHDKGRGRPARPPAMIQSQVDATSVNRVARPHANGGATLDLTSTVAQQLVSTSLATTAQELVSTSSSFKPIDDLLLNINGVEDMHSSSLSASLQAALQAPPPLPPSLFNGAAATLPLVQPPTDLLADFGDDTAWLSKSSPLDMALNPPVDFESNAWDANPPPPCGFDSGEVAAPPSGFDCFDPIPRSTVGSVSPQPKLDLDSTLAALASNFTIGISGQASKSSENLWRAPSPMQGGQSAVNTPPPSQFLQ